jgi:hypothetical protein
LDRRAPDIRRAHQSHCPVGLAHGHHGPGQPTGGGRSTHGR